MRILATTIVCVLGMMMTTAGFAGDEPAAAEEPVEAAIEAMPSVKAAPLETPVAAPADLGEEATKAAAKLVDAAKYAN